MTNRFVLRYSIPLFCLSIAVLLTAIGGCKRQANIESHRIPKSRSGLEALRSPQNQLGANSLESQMSPQSPSDRMVVGLFELDSGTWFFKIVGPLDKVKQTESAWKSFLGSVKFEDGKPVWELPAGWKAAKERPMRFATLQIGEFDPPLELAVSSLSANQDRLLNVNRWRDQLGLPEIDADQLDDNLKKLESADNSVLIFDAAGKSSGGMMPPFARGPLANQPPVRKNPATGVATAKSELEFEVPEGWESGKTSSMVAVRLQTNLGDKSAQITVVQMPADANEWEPNAKRWAGEVGLGKLTPEELNTLTREFEVDGHPGQLLDLTKEDSDSAKSTIAGMIKRAGTAWFLKLTGDKQVVVESEPEFNDFLDSLKFPEN